MMQLAEDTGRFRAAAAPSSTSGATASTGAVDVRITGWGRWQTVIVPPNAHVVHTRRGHEKPLHIGLGMSFPYNPNKDSFIVVPGTMQTILINAHCICRELQGLLVQGYVQWIIADFATAYKKLDFGDPDDPMRLVNLQLREQAEAAIKDKVATMRIDDVLSDKQPIIEELTARLRHVAEGQGGSDKGLGLRIVTVQVKEAVVSSARLWESLQKPFRAERARIARLAELESEEVISVREAETQKKSKTTQMETEAQLSVIRGKNDAEHFDRDAAEKQRRAQKDHGAAVEAFAREKQRAAAEAEVTRGKLVEQQAQHAMQLEGKLKLDDLRAAGENRVAKLQLETLELKTKIQNQVSPAALQAKLIEALPSVVEKLPKPNELKAVTIGSDVHGVAGAVAQIVSVVKALDGVTKQS
jgi:flotillin